MKVTLFHFPNTASPTDLPFVDYIVMNEICVSLSNHQ